MVENSCIIHHVIPSRYYTSLLFGHMVIPLRAKQVGEFIEIRHKKISPTQYQVGIIILDYSVVWSNLAVQFLINLAVWSKIWMSSFLFIRPSGFGQVRFFCVFSEDFNYHIIALKSMSKAKQSKVEQSMNKMPEHYL